MLLVLFPLTIALLHVSVQALALGLPFTLVQGIDCRKVVSLA